MLPHDTKGRDWGLIIGQRHEKILGSNVAGIIESVGSGATSVAKGDRVFGISSIKGTNSDQAGLQQYAILDETAIAQSPAGFSEEQVVTLPINVVTSWVVLFSEAGFGFPAPLSKEAKSFDYAAKSIVIIGGGSNVGKFAVQLAAIAGIGKIVAIAGASNKNALMKMGATHVIDRREVPGEIAAQVEEALGAQGATYVYDCVNNTAAAAISVLPSTKPSVLRNISFIGGEEAEKLKSQRPLCDARFLQCFNDEEFWKHVGTWMVERKLLPTEFGVIEGLERVGEINEALDGYRDYGTRGQSGGKQGVVKI